ncbi:aminotransferase class IV family protein [Micromonospora sp. Llam7]|uniref:aminotransferase class IV family protein n=1 Tax=Micromonospora tarapacensis TaxID=2835305 RepID=UPI001C829B56|nr:aminotransferase class IV family protein [Micromonospora tarapacensis]MBX7264781.1 aminotransferase class IV family protein [Micromonospora tarapacensis]
MAELNGTPITPKELQSLALINYGHFTSMRVENGCVRGLSHHLERLVRDCRKLFAVELDRGLIRQYVHQALDDRDGLFAARVTVFDPGLDMASPSRSPSYPGVLVTLREASTLPLPPLRVQSRTYTRDLPEAKHIGLFGALWHRRAAQLTGFDDAVFSDADGYLSEGPTWNLGFFDGADVVWPNAEVLPGVTMRLLQQVHDHTILAPVNLADLRGMEAAFATNVTFGMRPISQIDDVELPTEHAILDDLCKEYEAIPAEPL